MNNAVRVGLILLSSLAVATVHFVVALAAAQTQEGAKVCPRVEVRSINKAADKSDLKIGIAEIRMVPGLTSETSSTATAKTLTLVALGPVLGSMDSSDVKTELTCTAKGVALTATITRSADYSGSALKNVLWRPKISLAVVPREVGAIFEAIWVMQLSTGAKVEHSQTPTQPDQRYPIRLTRNLSAGTP